MKIIIFFILLLNCMLILNCELISLSFRYFENINTNYFINCSNKAITQDNNIIKSNFTLQELTLIDLNLIINGKDNLNIINDVSLQKLTIVENNN